MLLFAVNNENIEERSNALGNPSGIRQRAQINGFFMASHCSPHCSHGIHPPQKGGVTSWVKEPSQEAEAATVKERIIDLGTP